MSTFPKSEKLCGQLRIAALYKEGKRFTAFPMRVTFRQLPDSDEAPKVLIWAPKSLFKHAVKRNHMRRLMREAYRLHQDLLGDKHFLIAFNYMDKEEQPYAVIEKAICKALLKVKGER